jgi:multidrug efflux system membrane fusion protein
LSRGQFLTFDNQIDATTGTVKAKARFPNPDGKLFPNQFVNVNLLVDTLQHAATVPVTAVRHGPQGDFVFVLQADKSVKLTLVKTGPAIGSDVAILAGVAVGQTVITEGADSLDDGSKVMLPGDRPQGQRPKSQGFFSRLFGGGGSDAAAGQGAGAGNRSGDGNSSEGGERRRKRQAEGQGG